MIQLPTEKPIIHRLRNCLSISYLQKLRGGGKTLTASVLRPLARYSFSLYPTLRTLPLLLFLLPAAALFVASCEKQLTDEDETTRSLATDTTSQDSTTLEITIGGARWGDDGSGDSSDDDDSSAVTITIHPEWNDTNYYEF